MSFSLVGVSTVVSPCCFASAQSSIKVHSLTGISFFLFFSSDLAIAHDENDHCCHSCRHGLFVTGSRLKGSHVRVVQDLVVGRKL